MEKKKDVEYFPHQATEQEEKQQQESNQHPHPSRNFFINKLSESCGSASSVVTDPTWSLCSAKFSRAGVVFFCQVFILYICALTCIINLSREETPSKDLWITLLSFCIGSILPAPKVKKRRFLPVDGSNNSSAFSSDRFAV